MEKLVELGLILTAAVAPLFLLASKVSGDEFVKAGSGVFLAGTTAAVIAIYRAWKSR